MLQTDCLHNQGYRGQGMTIAVPWLVLLKIDLGVKKAVGVETEYGVPVLFLNDTQYLNVCAETELTVLKTATIKIRLIFFMEHYF